MYSGIRAVANFLMHCIPGTSLEYPWIRKPEYRSKQLSIDGMEFAIPQDKMATPSILRFARYSTYASYLRGNRAAYTTKTHIIGAFAPPVNGHRVAMTLCNKKFSGLEICDGNGVVEELKDQIITCKVCQKARS